MNRTEAYKYYNIPVVGREGVYGKFLFQIPIGVKQTSPNVSDFKKKHFIIITHGSVI